MRLLFICLFSLTNIVIAQNVKPTIPPKLKTSFQPEKIKREYINLIARQIFNDETNLYEFIGIDCKNLEEAKSGVWNCYIRQSATNFKNGHYTVNPPGVGNWNLTINFLKNTYLLKKQ